MLIRLSLVVCAYDFVLSDDYGSKLRKCGSAYVERETAVQNENMLDYSH
jgi:hypothetical protein